MRRWLKTRTYFNDPPVVPPVPPAPPPPQMFTQEQVNKMMADHKKTLQAQNQELVTQLETLKQSAGLTQQERDDLQTRIDALTSQHQTESERLKSQLDKTTKESKAALEAAANESSRWQKEYQRLLISNGIAAGAMEHKAANPDQLTAMLLPQAKVVEVLDDSGKATGVFEARLPMTVTDKKTGKPVAVELPLVEAIGKLREDPKNANLFLVDGRPGFGGSNAGSAGGNPNPDVTKMSHEQFREMRKKTYAK
jgi:hypothetical protein